MVAQYALQAAPPPEETKRDRGVEQVQHTPLRRLGRDQIEHVDKGVVLANRFSASTPGYELELRDLAIGLKIAVSSGVACTERDRLNLLTRLEDVRKRDENADRVADDIDLIFPGFRGIGILVLRVADSRGGEPCRSQIALSGRWWAFSQPSRAEKKGLGTLGRFLLDEIIKVSEEGSEELDSSNDRGIT